MKLNPIPKGLPRTVSSLLGNRNRCLLLLIGAFLLSRCIYYWMGIRFDTAALRNFWQIIDPALLHQEPWQSLLHERAQLPGLNLYIALVMHFFPRHSVAAYSASSLGLGLVLAVCMFLLLDRLRVSRPLSFFTAVVSVISPVAALYENWLCYEYPIAVSFCVAALFLHRYAKGGLPVDGLVFFFSLLSLALLRVIYHLVWFWLIAAVLAYVLPKYRRRTVLCALVPGLILSLVYLKSILLFGTFMPGGDVIGSINLAHLSSDFVNKETLAKMAAGGTISPALIPAMQYKFADPAFAMLIETPPKTGYRILDERLKSTGSINMDSLFMAAVGRQIRRDGLTVLRSHPVGVLVHVAQNIQRYFLPADLGWPFDESHPPNKRILTPLLTIFDLITTGNHPSNRYAPVSYIIIPLLLWYGLRRSARWVKRTMRSRKSNANDLTMIFAAGNIAYLTAIIIFYDYTDQNRILLEVYPLFGVLLGMLSISLTRRIRRPARGGRHMASRA